MMQAPGPSLQVRGIQRELFQEKPQIIIGILRTVVSGILLVFGLRARL